MKIYIFLILIVLVILLTRRESFTEIFGFSGYNKPVDYIRLNDPRPNLSGYSEVEVSADNDMMETFVIQANDEISKRIGTPTYIIETTKIKKYTGGDGDIYECVFMVMKKGGFTYGFSVVASFEVKGDAVNLTSLRSQPLDAKQPSDVKAFTEGSQGKEFIKFDLIKEVAMPTRGEFEKAKNNLQ
jgi:hypothetical protein